MRLILITLLTVTAAAGCAKSAGFTDAKTEAAALRRGFESIAPLEIADKAKALEPFAEKRAPALVAALEKITPPTQKAGCHADALAGARRASGAMRDLLKVYRDNTLDLAIASARNVDEGLTQLESALDLCSR
jgi:hypothetical protein